MYEADPNEFDTRGQCPPAPPLGNFMNILCAHHAKNPETCKWVIDQYGHVTNNTTVMLWVAACKEYLQVLNDGADTGSTGLRVET